MTSIRKSAPPNSIGQPRVDFIKPAFDSLIWDKGYKIIVYDAIECPCKSGNTTNLSNCSNCLGLGWVFINPLETIGIITAINKDTQYKYWSPEFKGTVAVTLRDIERLSFMDKIILKNEVSILSEVRSVRSEEITIPQPEYKGKYGALYNRYAVMDTRNICSEGWHIPSKSEVQILGSYFGNDVGYFTISGGALADTDIYYWDDITPFTNISKFNARGNGFRFGGSFINIKNSFQCWVTTDEQGGYKTFSIQSGFSDFYYNGGYVDQSHGSGLRPVKDSTTLSNGESGTYTGNDGKVYPTICIGTQEWLAENLNETKFRTGDWIHGYDNGVYTPIPDGDWAALETEAMCYFNDDETNGGEFNIVQIPIPQKFIFTSYPVNRVNSIFIFNGASNPLILLSPEDYEVSPANPYVVKLNHEFDEDFNNVVSIDYNHNIQYNVVDLPHDVRSSTKMNNMGRNEVLKLPIQAIAQKSHYITGDSPKYDGTGIQDNSYLPKK